MRIVLLGAPGSGKGTQAELLVRELDLPHISTGELLRAAVKAGTLLGRKAKEVMDRGELVSDEVMLHLIEARLSESDAKDGFILDGYPRNLAQAEALDELLERIGQPVDEALQIDVDIEMVIERIVKRAVEEEYYARKGLLSRVLGEGSIDEVFQRIRGVLQIRSA
jgi:adenylate kinase